MTDREREMTGPLVYCFIATGFGDVPTQSVSFRRRRAVVEFNGRCSGRLINRRAAAA
jgi:hypothetical protein